MLGPKEDNLTHTIALFLLIFIMQATAPKKAVITERQTKITKFGDIQDHGDFIIAEGVWRADNLSEKTELGVSAVSRLECYKTGGRQIVGSEPYCMEAIAKAIGEDFPDIEVDYFPVIRWDKDFIIAANLTTAPFPICVWTQITVSLREQSIMATDTRKLGKGHGGFNNVCEKMPLAQTYHLMDKVEELTRRQVGASKQKKPK
jgi:hypothetical protein